MEKETGREKRHGESETGKDVQTERRDKARDVRRGGKRDIIDGIVMSTLV